MQVYINDDRPLPIDANIQTYTQIGARGDCFKGLDSYIPLYEVVDDEYQPASFRSNLHGSTSSEARLMPLAIKFNVYTQHVYSPKDTHADWLLAKAAFNALDRDVNAIYHFVYHVALANIAIAAHK